MTPEALHIQTANGGARRTQYVKNKANNHTTRVMLLQ